MYRCFHLLEFLCLFTGAIFSDLNFAHSSNGSNSIARSENLTDIESKLQTQSSLYVDLQNKLNDAKQQFVTALSDAEKTAAESLVNSYSKQMDGISKELTNLSESKNRILAAISGTQSTASANIDNAIALASNLLSEKNGEWQKAKEQLASATTEGERQISQTMLDAATLAKSLAENQYQMLQGQKNEIISGVNKSVDEIKTALDAEKNKALASASDFITEIQETTKNALTEKGGEIIKTTVSQLTELQQKMQDSLKTSVEYVKSSLGTTVGATGSVVGTLANNIGGVAVGQLVAMTGLPSSVVSGGLNMAIGSLLGAFSANAQGIKDQAMAAIPTLSKELALSPEATNNVTKTVTDLFNSFGKMEVSFQGVSSVGFEYDLQNSIKKISEIEGKLSSAVEGTLSHTNLSKMLNEYKDIQATTEKILVSSQKVSDSSLLIAKIKTQLTNKLLSDDERTKLNTRLSGIEELYNIEIKKFNNLKEKQTLATNLAGYIKNTTTYGENIVQLTANKRNVEDSLNTKKQVLDNIVAEIAKYSPDAVPADLVTRKTIAEQECAIIQKSFNSLNENINYYTNYLISDSKVIDTLTQNKTVIEKIINSAETISTACETKIEKQTTIEDITDKLQLSQSDEEADQLNAMKSQLEEEIKGLDLQKRTHNEIMKIDETKKLEFAASSISMQSTAVVVEKNIFSNMFESVKNIAKTTISGLFGSLFGKPKTEETMKENIENERTKEESSEELSQHIEEQAAERAEELAAEHHR